MLPETVRTGDVTIKEQGFTSYFSVDGESHSFSVRYYDNDWKPFPDHLKKRLARMVSSVWVASIPAKEKVFTHRLNDADIELLEFITYQTQGHYRRAMKYPSLESNPTMHVTEGDDDWSDIELDDEGCGLYFSGGRDAFSTLGLLEDADYDPHLLQVNNGSSWDAGEKSRETFMEDWDRHIDTAWNNFPVLKREITKDHGIFWHREAPIFYMTFFMSLPILEKSLMFFGNEATTTRFCNVGRDRILNSSWEQSQFSTYLMTQWAQKNGFDLRVGSILREMGDYRVMKELVERHRDYWDLSVSCFFVDTDNDYSPCSKCHKDFRNYLCLSAIGADTSQYDMERLQEFEMDPANLMWKTLLPNDFAHMVHKGILEDQLIGDMNFSMDFLDIPAQERPEIEGLMFKRERANPSYFLDREEFKRIYEAVMDDDSAHLPVDDGANWYHTEDLDHVYDVISEWDVADTFDYSAKITSNNSLLDY